jgi:hypothetical protein
MSFRLKTEGDCSTKFFISVFFHELTRYGQGHYEWAKIKIFTNFIFYQDIHEKHETFHGLFCGMTKLSRDYTGKVEKHIQLANFSCIVHGV